MCERANDRGRKTWIVGRVLHEEPQHGKSVSAIVLNDARILKATGKVPYLRYYVGPYAIGLHVFFVTLLGLVILLQTLA